MSLIVNIQSILSEVNLQPLINIFLVVLFVLLLKLTNFAVFLYILINVHCVFYSLFKLVCVNENKNRGDYCP